MIRQLLYRSGQLSEFTGPEMGRLLQRARLANARAGIGGMLLYHDGLFMQMLEGPLAAVDALYARIAADVRHCEVRLLVRSERAHALLPGVALAWAETVPEGGPPAFPGLASDRRALDLLVRAGADRVATAMRSFLQGDAVPGGGLGCVRVAERVL